jgi:hypothetical protein
MSFTTIGDLSQSFQLRRDNARLKGRCSVSPRTFDRPHRRSARRHAGRLPPARGARAVGGAAGAFRTSNAEAALFAEVAQTRSPMWRPARAAFPPPRCSRAPRRSRADRRGGARGDPAVRGGRRPAERPGGRPVRLRGPRDGRPGAAPGRGDPRCARDRRRRRHDGGGCLRAGRLVRSGRLLRDFRLHREARSRCRPSVSRAANRSIPP